MPIAVVPSSFSSSFDQLVALVGFVVAEAYASAWGLERLIMPLAHNKCIYIWGDRVTGAIPKRPVTFVIRLANTSHA